MIKDPETGVLRSFDFDNLLEKIPELKPWYLNEYVPPQPRIQAAPKRARTQVVASQAMMADIGLP